MTIEQIYSTAQLIEILEKELQAAKSGQRKAIATEQEKIAVQELMTADGYAPFGLSIDSWLDVGAYHEFRELIWDYQRQHQVSGLVEKTIAWGNAIKVFQFPHDQLTLLDSDLEFLRQQKQSVIDFFMAAVQSSPVPPFMVIEGMLKNGAEINVDVDRQWLAEELNQYWYTWAILSSHANQLALTIGWGNPQQAPYRDCPDSDSIVVYLPGALVDAILL